jgi:hypothetical protein
MVLSALGERMEGTARSNYVNKFHSPVFKLMEENLEEPLIPFIERAYETILEMGGNRNDSAVESNLSACLGILENGSSKDVRKMGAYATLRILVASSPYITFKKLLQKQKSSNLDNLSLAIASARVRNLKVRLAYLHFLVEYVKYIAEKKDRNFETMQRSSKKPPFNASMKITRISRPRKTIRKQIISTLRRWACS